MSTSSLLPNFGSSSPGISLPIKLCLGLVPIALTLWLLSRLYRPHRGSQIIIFGFPVHHNPNEELSINFPFIFSLCKKPSGEIMLFLLGLLLHVKSSGEVLIRFPLLFSIHTQPGGQVTLKLLGIVLRTSRNSFPAISFEFHFILIVLLVVYFILKRR